MMFTLVKSIPSNLSHVGVSATSYFKNLTLSVDEVWLLVLVELPPSRSGVSSAVGSVGVTVRVDLDGVVLPPHGLDCLADNVPGELLLNLWSVGLVGNVEVVVSVVEKIPV